MSPQVHWHEGLFLQPHHFQVMQRGLINQVHTHRKLAWHYPWGVIESRLAPDALKAYWVRFETLRALMPSGVLIEAGLGGANAMIEPLEIKRELASCQGALTVLLGVPLHYQDRANIAPSSKPGAEADRASYHYRISQERFADENTGSNPQEVLLRQINARLLVQTSPEQRFVGWETLPLLRFRRAPDRAEDLPREDDRFVPPCLILKGSDLLRGITQALANKIAATRDELADRLARGGLTGDERLAAVLRCRTLAGTGSRFASLAAVPNVTPFEVYTLLRELLGELIALGIDASGGSAEFGVEPYQHENPLSCFDDLATRIRRKLVVEQREYSSVKFIENNRGVHAVTLKDEHIVKPQKYYLGIKTIADPTNFVSTFEDSNKVLLVPESSAQVADYGISLVSHFPPPSELPHERECSYFEVQLRESSYWERVKTEKKLVLIWPKEELELSGVAFELLMTLPD